MDQYMKKNKREERTAESIEFEKAQAELTFHPKLSASQPQIEHLRKNDVSPANMQRTIKNTYNNLDQKKSYTDKILKKNMGDAKFTNGSKVNTPNFKPQQKRGYDPYQKSPNEAPQSVPYPKETYEEETPNKTLDEYLQQQSSN